MMFMNKKIKGRWWSDMYKLDKILNPNNIGLVLFSDSISLGSTTLWAQTFMSLARCLI